MEFTYEAMRRDGTTVVNRIEAAGQADAAESLREKGLVVMRLEELNEIAKSAKPGGFQLHGKSVNARDLVLLTRQLKMLLEAGAPLVPALAAAAEQTGKPVMRALIERLHDCVEEGDTLTEAMEHEKQIFDPVFRSMIAAGEATGSLPQVFGRLCELSEQQLRVKTMVRGALLYPCLLSILMIGVVIMLMTFVVPRFNGLFASLGRPLPATTKMLFGVSAWLQTGWPFVVGGAIAAIIGLVMLWRAPKTRATIDNLLLRTPMIGRLAGRLIFARVVRVWAAMLRCHVPLLEVIRQSREAVSNAVYLERLASVEETVASGGRVGQALSEARLADAVIVSALRTGEENGRLAEAAEFISNWMDEDNGTAVQHATRLAEPVLLAGMGIVVAFVAMGLFVPLFDIAMAAG
jgi:type II secretory pathway component PulF